MFAKNQRVERAEKEAFWRPHLSAWESSGLNVKAYCKANCLKQHQFKYWQHQLASKTKAETDTPSPNSSEFIELTSIASSAPALSTSLEINIKHGLSITLRGALNAEIVKTLLNEIKGFAC